LSVRIPFTFIALLLVHLLRDLRHPDLLGLVLLLAVHVVVTRQLRCLIRFRWRLMRGGLRLFLVCSGDVLAGWHQVFVLVLVGLEVGSEDIVGVLGGGHKHLTVVGVETELLQVVLALMQEYKLWWDVFSAWRLL
jgi:hypothetical protein